MDSRPAKRARLTQAAAEDHANAPSRALERNRGGRGRGRGMNTSGAARNNSSSNDGEPSIGGRSEITTPATATSIIPFERTGTGETPRSEASFEQAQTDLNAVRTDRDTLISKMSDYKVRVHNMDLDSKRTNITVSALAKRVEEMEKANETLRTENMSISKQNQELVTTYMDRVPTTSGRAKKHKLLSSLPRIYYGFATDLEKTIAPWARKEVSELFTNSATV